MTRFPDFSEWRDYSWKVNTCNVPCAWARTPEHGGVQLSLPGPGRERGILHTHHHHTAAMQHCSSGYIGTITPLNIL